MLTFVFALVLALPHGLILASAHALVLALTQAPVLALVHVRFAWLLLALSALALSALALFHFAACSLALSALVCFHFHLSCILVFTLTFGFLFRFRFEFSGHSLALLAVALCQIAGQGASDQDGIALAFLFEGARLSCGLSDFSFSAGVIATLLSAFNGRKLVDGQCSFTLCSVLVGTQHGQLGLVHEAGVSGLQIATE